MQLIVKKQSKWIKTSKIFFKNQPMNVATAQHYLQALRKWMREKQIDDEWLIFDIDTDTFTFTTDKIEVHTQSVENIADLLSKDISKQLPHLSLSEEHKQMLENMSLAFYDEMATGEIQVQSSTEKSFGFLDKISNLFQEKINSNAKVEGKPTVSTNYHEEWTKEEKANENKEAKQHIIPEIPLDTGLNEKDEKIAYADETLQSDNQNVQTYTSSLEPALSFESVSKEEIRKTQKEVDQIDESSLPNRHHLIELYRKKILQSDDLLKMLQLNKQNLSDMDKKRLNYLLDHQDEVQNMMEELTSNLIYVIQKLENDLRSSIEAKRENLLSQRVLDDVVKEPLEIYQKVLEEELAKSLEENTTLIDKQFEKEKTQLERAHKRALKDLELKYESEKELQKNTLGKEGTQANHYKIETYHQDLLNQEKVRRSRELQDYISEQNIDFYNSLKDEVDGLKSKRDEFFQQMHDKMENLKPVWEREIAEEKLAKSETLNEQHKQMMVELQDTISELKAVQKDVEQANDEISYREQMRQTFERDMRQKELEWQAISEKRDQLMRTLDQERENLQKEREQFYLEKQQKANLPVLNEHDFEENPWYQKWQIWTGILALSLLLGGVVFASNQIINQEVQQEKNAQIQAHKKSIERLEKKLEQLEDKQTNTTADAQVQAFNEALANNHKDEIIRTYEALNPTQQSRLTADEIYQVGQAYLAKNMVDKAQQLPKKSSSLNSLIDSFNNLQTRIVEAEQIQDTTQKESLEQTRNDLLGVLNNEGKG